MAKARKGKKKGKRAKASKGKRKAKRARARKGAKRKAAPKRAKVSRTEPAPYMTYGTSPEEMSGTSYSQDQMATEPVEPVADEFTSSSDDSSSM